MTSTDRAFIDAYRRTAPTVSIDQAPEPTAARSSGPHFLRMHEESAAPRRAPLSTLIAERRDNAATAAAVSRRRVASFTWPDAPALLAKHHTTALLNVLTSLGESVVTLVGARAGVGSTTIALALGRAASAAGLRVAIVDSNPVASDLAVAIGAGRITTLAEAVERGAAATDTVATAERERVSVAVGGGPISAGGARRQLAALAEANDLVVVDGGAVDAASHEPPTAWTRAANSVTVVAAKPEDAETTRALRLLEAARVAVNGVIENRAA